MYVISCYIAFISVLRALIINNYNKKIFNFIAAGLLIFITGCRSIYFGPDTIGYVMNYNSMAAYNINTLWSYLINYNIKDPVFYFLSGLLSIVGINYQIWIAIISVIFLFSVSNLIYKYSNEIYISYISLISLGYLYFITSGLRQSVAIAIILFSYKYLIKRKLFLFVGVIAIASLFHWSAWIFLIAYPLSKIRNSIIYFIGITSSLIIAFFYGNFIRYAVNILAYNEIMRSYVEWQKSLNLSGFIINFCVFLFCLYYKERVVKDNTENLILYNLLFLGVFFQPFSLIIGEFFRISIYFSIFSIILIPKVIKSENDKWLRSILYFFILFILIFYVYWSKSFSTYKFYWNV